MPRKRKSKEEKKEVVRIWQAKHKEYLNAKSKAWREEHQEEVKFYQLYRIKPRTKRKKIIMLRLESYFQNNFPKRRKPSEKQLERITEWMADPENRELYDTDPQVKIKVDVFLSSAKDDFVWIPLCAVRELCRKPKRNILEIPLTDPSPNRPLAEPVVAPNLPPTPETLFQFADRRACILCGRPSFIRVCAEHGLEELKELCFPVASTNPDIRSAIREQGLKAHQKIESLKEIFRRGNIFAIRMGRNEVGKIWRINPKEPVNYDEEFIRKVMAYNGVTRCHYIFEPPRTTPIPLVEKKYKRLPLT